MTQTTIAKLQEMREYGGKRVTIGLPDALLSQFLANDPTLTRAIDEIMQVPIDLHSAREHVRDGIIIPMCINPLDVDAVLTEGDQPGMYAFTCTATIDEAFDALVAGTAARTTCTRW